MKNKHKFYVFINVFSMLMLTMLTIQAQDTTNVETVSVSGAWIRPSENVTAAYFQIRNNTQDDIELVAVETPLGIAEIHETRVEDDVMRMQQVESVTIEAEGSLSFEPGSYHVMIMNLTDPLIEGEDVPLELIFASGISREVIARVSQFPIPYILEADVLTEESLLASENEIFIGQVVNPPIQVQDFSAPSNFEDITQLSDTNGTWRVIFFGYIHCPDFCPLTLLDYVRAKEILGDSAEHITFMLISVDSIRDTADVMTPYLANFDPAFVGFSPDDIILSRIQPDYGFYYARRMDSGTQAIYTVDHSTRSYLLDPNGVLRASFAYDTHPQDIADALLWYIDHETLLEEE